MLFRFQMSELECSFTLIQNCMRKAPTFLFYNECVWGTPPSILLALTVRKRCQPSKSTNGFQRYGKKNISTQKCFWLNLSKKVKCHFCINLDTGYLLYVVLWIPKAFSLPYQGQFSLSKKEFLDGHYNLQFFTM